MSMLEAVKKWFSFSGKGVKMTFEADEIEVERGETYEKTKQKRVEQDPSAPGGQDWIGPGYPKV